MKFNLILITFALVLGACSSSKFKSTEHEDIERDYEVKDSSSNSRPGWIEDANGWASENDIDTKISHTTLLKRRQKYQGRLLVT